MARRSSTIVPLRAQRRRTRARKLTWWREFTPIMVILPLATFAAVFLWGGPPLAGAFEFSAPALTAIDRESASFSRCSGPVRTNCVVDGDTFWYGGEKIRIADINTPEVSKPQCAHEAQLGARATDRLQTLLNDGAFTLAPNNDGSDRDHNRYGRLLRTVTRDDESLGTALVREGLAEKWKGYRGSWC